MSEVLKKESHILGQIQKNHHPSQLKFYGF